MWRARSATRWGLGLLSLAALAGCCPDALYETTTEKPVVRLPLDESPHCFGGGEWWYYTGRLETDIGAGYGVEVVIFHVPRWPFLLITDEWMAHLAVLDETRGAFQYEQTRSRGPSMITGSGEVGFDLQTGLVQMCGGDGLDHVQAAMRDGTYALDLDLTDERGAILHGDGGYIPYGANRRSFYYSRPRMRATGTLQVDGQPQNVSGELWFDRQWGRDLTSPWLRWDWFSLRLNDGTSVMLYQFHEGRPPVALGTYIPRTGEPFTLAASDFEVTPTDGWTSPYTGITYPVGWEVRIVPQDLVLTVTAVVDDQELDARASTLNIYWEGLCTVDGVGAGQPIGGTAYVELTNYPP